MPAHSVIFENIDVEPGLFEQLARQIMEGIDAETADDDAAVVPSDRLFFLCHQRKLGPIDHDRRQAVLTAAGKAFDGASEKADMLFLVDCGVLADDGVHSDLSLLSDIVQRLSHHVSPDTNMDIVLIDHEGECDGQTFGAIDVRSLRDPSVLQDNMERAMEALGDIDTGALNLSEQDVDAIMEDVMVRLREELPPEVFEENRAS